MIRPALSATLALLLIAASAPGLAAQPMQTAAEGFAAAWGTADREGLLIRFRDPSRLSLGGTAHTGLRPEQAVSAIEAVLRDHEVVMPRIVRAEPMESREGAGFAELFWETRDLATGTPVQRTILITFTRVDATLLVSDLRLVS